MRARDSWYDSGSCMIHGLIDYMRKAGKLRDAQIDAVKTYLYLKTSCGNRPLAELFCEGKFNSLDIDALEVSNAVRNKLLATPAAAALYEYVSEKNSSGGQVSEKIAKEIRTNPDAVDYDQYFKKAFYDVTYPDYLFSLPMGAGKTFLMASFIYLDLYFARNEPDNPVFAHNFVILAPSGLKSSVVPSLKTIRAFDPSWVLPEPAASDIKRLIKFEVLDQNKTDRNSNKIKNPNVQKIALHQPFDSLMGLVAVTNAEKVILDGLALDKQNDFFEESDDASDRAANELRHTIGQIPSLAVYIDEVHHATDSEKKLRSVVSRWMRQKTVTGVVGFSGTPYLEKPEKIQVTDSLQAASADIANTVYYYPLAGAIGNFLKRPVVKISNNADSLEIIEAGVREFFNMYKDTVYVQPSGNLTAKLGIYCGAGIDFLEDEVYPLVTRIVTEYGMNAEEAVLRFHGGNKEHPAAAESRMQFEILDTAESKIRVVLLCQIGKEGWDCRSLTGIILSQEGDCPTNMVLQTSCRCLRQVDRNQKETALIYLNESNAEKLNRQLAQQQHMTLDEFQKGCAGTDTLRRRYNRMDYLHVPPIDFYQLRVSYNTVVTEKPEVEKDLPEAVNGTERGDEIITTEENFDASQRSVSVIRKEHGTVHAGFNQWLYMIAGESFGYVTLNMVKNYEDVLKKVFAAVTFTKDGESYFSSFYDQNAVRANIRKAFYEKRDFSTTEELIAGTASLLAVENFTDEVAAAKAADFYPDEETAGKIIGADNGNLTMPEEAEKIINLYRQMGKEKEASEVEKAYLAYPYKDRTFHYLPYHTSSSFEQIFLEEVLSIDIVKKNNLEVYYNGDSALTEFRICCYRQNKTGWNYIGKYTPDFLIIQRRKDAIYKVIIVETKGSLYAHDPAFIDRKKFTEMSFVQKNNEKFGYRKFSYLYLEDSMSEGDRIAKTAGAIKDFFEGEQIAAEIPL
ncbi:MAG: DEAD/DEAH box helicase family protein [Treponema sp.]|nr:DEAD/DEAH box helicase family protein [Treponema sp.]